MAFYLKCKMCGGDIEIQEGATVAKCRYCGSLMTLPKIDTDKKARLFNKANEYRQNNEFDKSYDAYKAITEEDPEEAEAYWGMILSEYGIEYVEDPNSGKRIPTCHRVQTQFVQNSSNYKLALKYADAERKIMYKEEAECLDSLQKDILSISSRELPYDVFICYKETDDETGERTEDSVLAQEIYNELTRAGVRTFFSRITLEDHLGENYEPYIYAALKSAKVMLVVTTDKDHLEAVWVKNEWMRYLRFMNEDKSKSIIPVYKRITPYELPTLLSVYQAADMSKIGAVQDLVRGVERILGQKEITEKDKLLNKVIEDQKKKLEEEEREAERKHQEELAIQRKKEARRARRKKYKALYIAGFVLIIALIAAAILYNNYNNTYLKPKKQYDAAMETLNNATLDNDGFRVAISEFESLQDFQDSKQMINEAYYRWAKAKIENGELSNAEIINKNNKDEALSNEILDLISSAKTEAAYQHAVKKMEEKKYLDAMKELSDLGEYKDSKERLDACCAEYYSITEELYNENNFSEAFTNFNILANYSYKDSSDRAAALNDILNEQKNAKQKIENAINGTWTMNGSTFMIKVQNYKWDTFADQYAWEDFKNFGLSDSLSYDEATDSYILIDDFMYFTYRATIDGDQMELSVLSDDRPGYGIDYSGIYTKTSDTID